ncbi:hypothetical protein [Oceanitalea stevensii]|uniref:MarR family transcriptional regulator n=1 Tax=Oceanitalea stevensii TaxID=2763072 RepID=A0ABR8Z4W6_9MICO|nr:hypothetical protein [Oceanitalea stevensii]MBD8063383.1 hypothetical protein [Oceanitalea stevensii]
MGREHDDESTAASGAAPLWMVSLMAQRAALHGRLGEVLAADEHRGESL